MLILDANVLIRSRGRLANDELITTPEVVEELKSDQSINNFEVNEINVIECKDKFYHKVKDLSSDINSNTSVTDEKIVGLGIQTGGKVITDDREIQNLCMRLDVNFDGFLDDPIEETRSWKVICSNCGAEVNSETCKKCGSSSTVRKTND